MLEFEDVKKCKNIEEFSKFVQQYLDERKLQGEERRKTYWALFYAWKETLNPFT
ncbi:MAG: hypothetical protein QXX51_03005 [Candidatus Bathyarchaeia archaeon]